MEVEIVSEENIKPSFPTPSHLRSFRLSLLDQLLPVPYAPIVLYYPNHDHHCAGHNTILQRLELLKKSLSETLTRFYPFAGKIKDDLYIECNDEGAYFVEAHVNFCLSEFLGPKPDLLLIHKFLPCDLVLKESAAGTFVTNVQANVFQCGGIVIGLCISHKIVDGAALSTFIKAWTTAARGSKSNIAANTVFPNFDSSSLFPASDLWLRDSSMAMWGSLFRKGKSVTRRFVFPGSATATLKAQASSSYVKKPSRLEVVSSFIWKHAMAASRQNNGYQKPSLMTHLVNLRRRMKFPLMSEHIMGNLLWIAAARCMETDDQASLESLVGELRGAISRIDGDFVEKMQGEERNSVVCETLREIEKLGSQDVADHFGFSSWCKFGFYEADFGWGKPIWVSSFGSSATVFMNLIILVDTRLGDGIEAWVTLDEPDMALLETNPELLTFASLDPSPLAVDHSIADHP